LRPILFFFFDYQNKHRELLNNTKLQTKEMNGGNFNWQSPLYLDSSEAKNFTSMALHASSLSKPLSQTSGIFQSRILFILKIN